MFIIRLRLARLEDMLELESVLSIVMRFRDTGVRGVDPSTRESEIRSILLWTIREIADLRQTTRLHHPALDSNKGHRTLE